MKGKLIGVCGEVGAGKDTTAKHFKRVAKRWDVDFTFQRFTKEIKDTIKFLADDFGLDLEDQDTKESLIPIKKGFPEGMTFRDLILEVGAGNLKPIFEHLSVFKLKERKEHGINQIFLDVRTKAQFNVIIENGGWILNVIPTFDTQKKINKHPIELEREEWLEENKENIKLFDFYNHFNQPELNEEQLVNLFFEVKNLN